MHETSGEKTCESEPKQINVQWLDPAGLRLHPLHKFLPGPRLDSPEWHAFVDNASGAGAAGLPPIYVTPEGFIMDGERRWRAARQLQWKTIAAIVRPEWEAALLMVESLFGQRCYSKGAKVYLSLLPLGEFIQSANSRRLANLKNGAATLEKPIKVPNPAQQGLAKGWAELAERWGVGHDTVEKAVRIRKTFELPALVGHKFPHEDGSESTLREYFEPRILDGEHPMSLGDAIKAIGYLVKDGKPQEHPVPVRHSHLFFWKTGWSNWGRQCQRWSTIMALGAEQKNDGLLAVRTAVAALPDDVARLLSTELREAKYSTS